MFSNRVDSAFQNDSQLKRRKTKSLELKEKINDLISSSTLHGLPNAVKSENYCIKLMWFILTLFFMCICALSIFKTVNDFLSYDVITRISVVNEQEVEFPTISFCKSFVNNINSTFELNILKCFFMGDTRCENDRNKYFESFKDPSYGTCYRFNSGKNMLGSQTSILKSYVTGPNYGLILDLNVTGDMLLNELSVFIHNKSQAPSTLFNIGYSLFSGSRNFFSVQRQLDYKLPEPYNSCLKDVSLFKENKTIINYILSKNRSYTQTECLKLCINLKYIENNKCRCGSFENFESIFAICFRFQPLNSTYKNCTESFFKNFDNETSSLSTFCSKYCPLECDSNTFSISLYSEVITLDGNLSQTQPFFKNYKTLEQVKKSYFQILVYYEQMRYTLIEQTPKIEFIDLLSNVGGILGVFLGVSFLSFFEIFEFFIEILSIILFKSNT